ncbi:MAG: hypothetical protein U1F43_22100 [Myxococcota bacterium]
MSARGPSFGAARWALGLVGLAGLAACGSSSSEKRPEPTPVAPRPLEGGRVGPGGMLGPIAPALGTFRWATVGCLEQGGKNDYDGDTFPVPAVTRDGPAAPALTAHAVPHGFVASHTIPHACCLEAATRVSIEDGATHVVHIDEVLSGDPCRCQCQSTVSTSVGVAPGTWDVVVSLTDRANAPIVTKTQVVVEAVPVLPRPSP